MQLSEIGSVKTSLKLKKVIILILVFSLCFSFLIETRAHFLTAQAYQEMKPVVYGKGCYSCFVTYFEDLRITLGQIGIIDIEAHYLGNDPQAASDLEQLQRGLNVPDNLKGNIAVSLNGKFLFEGSVPTKIIVDFLVNHTSEYNTLVIFRDELKDLYRIMDEYGHIRECNIQNSISECALEPEPASLVSLIFLVAFSGLVDGINPCAFSVLLFFIGILLTASKSNPNQQLRRNILMIGAVYILAVFLIYLAIGLSLTKIIGFTTFPYLFAKAGAVLMIFLGLVDIKDYFWHSQSFSWRILESRWKNIGFWMNKLTLPATFLAGLMVGFFEFPCTGGIYVGIISLLAAKTTFFEGFTYLILYNFTFILPLLVILALASNKRVEKVSLTTRKDSRIMRLLTGLIMFALGIFLLFQKFI